MSSFILDRFDPTQTPIEVDHAVTLKQTGLTWVGQYYSKFGELLLENMLHLSENFAGPVPPSAYDDNNATFTELVGQLWYDTDDHATLSNRTLKIYDGNEQPDTNGWKRIELIMSDEKPLDYTEGEMYYDTTRKTLAVGRVNRWESIMVEQAYDSERLVGIEGHHYMRKDIDQTMAGVLSATHILPNIHNVYNLGADTQRWKEIFVNVLNTQNSLSLIPLSDKTYDLGRLTRQWANIHVDVVRANSFTHIIPNSNTDNIGSTASKWNALYLKTAYIDAYSTITPRNNVQTIGTPVNRWYQGFFNLLNINAASSNFSPNWGESYTLGEDGRKWSELHVNVVKPARYDTLSANTTSANIGTPTDKFNTLHVRNVSDTTFVGDLNFDITRNQRSKGITWTGVDDTHSIYAEEYANSSSTRLVIESGNNPQDSTVIRNNGSDALEVKQDKVVAHKDVQADQRIILSDGSGKGVTMQYNAAIGTMEFKFI